MDARIHWRQASVERDMESGDVVISAPIGLTDHALRIFSRDAPRIADDTDFMRAAYVTDADEGGHRLEIRCESRVVEEIPGLIVVNFNRRAQQAVDVGRNEGLRDDRLDALRRALGQLPTNPVVQGDAR